MSSLDNPRDRAIQAMFDRIAGRYDILNRIISFRLDNTWRSKAIKEVLRSSDQFILDLGAGTGDLTFTAAKKIKGSGRIVGLDFSLEMLKLARSKQNSAKNGEKTCFIQGSATFSPFKDGAFDGVMTAFVLRNVSDLSLFFCSRVQSPKQRRKVRVFGYVSTKEDLVFSVLLAVLLPLSPMDRRTPVP